MMELLGYIGAICFAISAAPQAWKTYKDGNAYGLSWLFLGLWGIGEITSLVYSLYHMIGPYIVNYTLNLVFLIVMVYYKIKPRSKDD